MAEVFTNAQIRGAGSVSTKTGGTIGATATTITGITTTSINVGDIVDNQHFRGGAKVSVIGSSQVTVDTTAYTSPGATKSILIGGTFANLTDSNINVSIEIKSGSTSTNIANDIPIPTGSSFVISDAGKVIMLAADEIRVYCDTANAVDVTLGILQGVN